MKSDNRQRYRRLGAIAAILVAASFGMVIAAGTSTAGPRRSGGPIGVQGITPGTYQNLINVARGRCLSVNSTDNRNGEPLVQFNCYQYPDQYWLFEPIAAAPGYYRLRNLYTNRCAAVPNPRNGAIVVQYDCIDGYYDQWFRPELMPDGISHRLRNYKSNRCLAAPTGINGARISNYDCILGYTDQHWHIWP